MSGHSHWATIRRKKGAVDAKKGQMFSKLAKAITIAARQGGADAASNLSLKYAMDKARQFSMPKDNIDRAIKKGTGEGDGAQLESVKYEAIGPGGVFILIECLTDSRNRTASEVRKLLELKNARLGSVAWAFEQKALVTLAGEGVTEDQILEVALDAGADDVQKVGSSFQVTAAPHDGEAVRRALTEKGFKVEAFEVIQAAKTPMAVDEETGRKVLDLLGQIEDHDDVQNVYSNVDLPESLMKE